jgi:hypothetical protein
MNETAEKCRELGNKWFEQGRTEEALLLLERAVLSAPHDATLVLDYAARAEAALGAEPDEARSDRIEALESFVRNRILHVALDRAEDVLACANRLRIARAAGNEGPVAESTLSEAGPVDDSARVADLSGPPPLDAAALSQHIKMLERRQLSLDDSHQGPLAEALEQMRLAQSFDEVLNNATAMLARIPQWRSVPREAAALQHIEGTLRQLALMAEAVGDERLARLDVALGNLKTQGVRVSAHAQEVEADERWNGLIATHGRDIDKIVEFSAPDSAQPDGACETILSSGRDSLQRVHELIPQLGRTRAGTLAQGRATALAQALARTARSQQVRYDKWALERIRGGYRASDEFIGTLMDKEEKLGDALVEQFACIEVRHLGPEVQRCFSEVFELLYAHLDKPSSPKAFDKPGNKLNVLSRMMNANKTALSDF